MEKLRQSTSYSAGRGQRLRTLFLNKGQAKIKKYECLELLLSYAAQDKDLKMLADNLIRHFGSCAKAMDSPLGDILKVPGFDDHTAVLIALVKKCTECYLKERALKRQRLTCLKDLVEYCRYSMGGLHDEQFRVIFLNSQNEVIAEEIVQEGTVDQTVVYPRKVLELALKHKATGLILVHNHPSGHLKPSVADQELTRALVKAGQAFNLTVQDHLIISRHGYFSLAEQNML